MKKLLIALAVVALGTAFAACATTGEEAASRTLTVEVDNNLPSGGTITLWMHPQVGPRELLGTLSPGEVGRFEYQVQPAGRYRLEAESSAGADLWSRQFAAPGDVSRVVWDMYDNRVDLH